MTHVTYRMDPAEGCFEIKAEGHAEAGEYGHDIVCAAVSILMRTLEKCVIDDRLNGEMDKDKEEGRYCVRCMSTYPFQTSYTMTVFHVILKGFRLLAAQYPEYVTCEPYREEKT